MSGDGLKIETSAESYFFELVHGAVENQKIKIQPETEFYVVKLLTRFIFSESLYSKSSDGTLEDQPIALLYKEALEAPAPPIQKTLFQNVGDISLYKAGFFQESLNRTNIDLDYYIGMGGSAYLNASKITDDKHFQSLFSELSNKFDRFVNVLFEISEKTSLSSTKTEADIFRMYDLWSKTGSERAARVLKKSGIKVK
jgi:hypothetical protein